MNDQGTRVEPVVVVLPAEIDVTNSSEVRQQLLAALAPGIDVVVADLTATSFCDSSGVHTIIRAHEQAAAQGVEMRLAVPPDGSVRRVFQLTGAVRVVPVHSSLAEALQSA